MFVKIVGRRRSSGPSQSGRASTGSLRPGFAGDGSDPGRRSIMASGLTMGTSLRHLRDLFSGGTAVGPDRRPAPGPVRRLARRAGVRGPGGAARADGRGHLPRHPAARARRRGRLPGHFPGAGPQGRLGPRRRRPGRLAAPRGLSRRGAGERRGEAETPARVGGIGDGNRDCGRARAGLDPELRRSCTRRSTGCPTASGCRSCSATWRA